MNLVKHRQRDGMPKVDKTKCRIRMNGQTCILVRVLEEQDPVPEATMVEQHLFPEECPVFLLLSVIVNWQKRWQKRLFLMQKKIKDAVVFDKYFNHRVREIPDQPH